MSIWNGWMGSSKKEELVDMVYTPDPLGPIAPSTPATQTNMNMIAAQQAMQQYVQQSNTLGGIGGILGSPATTTGALSGYPYISKPSKAFYVEQDTYPVIDLSDESFAGVIITAKGERIKLTREELALRLGLTW